jgi:hypothetical protein
MTLSELKFQGGRLPLKVDLPKSRSCLKAWGVPSGGVIGMFEPPVNACLAEMQRRDLVVLNYLPI